MNTKKYLRHIYNAHSIFHEHNENIKFAKDVFNSNIYMSVLFLNKF
jgi:hypothetical protein